MIIHEETKESDMNCIFNKCKMTVIKLSRWNKRESREGSEGKGKNPIFSAYNCSDPRSVKEILRRKSST